VGKPQMALKAALRVWRWLRRRCAVLAIVFRDAITCGGVCYAPFGVSAHRLTAPSLPPP